MIDVATLRAWADAARPVFVCGVERSGTSMLQLALARHPALFAVPDVYETFMFANPGAILREPAPDMATAYLGGAAQVEWFRARYSACGLGDADLIRAFFHFAAHSVYPGRRPLEKTPSHVRHLARVFAVFPQASVVVCTRELEAVIASYRTRLAREQALGLPRSTWGWLDRSLPQLIAHVQAVAEQVRAAGERHGAQVFVAPYDWLTADAPAALDAICAFADLAPSAALLTPKPRQTSRVDALLTQPITARSAPEASPFSPEERAQTAAAARALPALWATPGPLSPAP